MGKELYPLTAAQLLHQLAIDEFSRPQVVNIGVCMALQAPLDYGLLKKCIQLEIERYECLRVRFTERQADGLPRQYICPFDSRDIELVDFSGVDERLANNTMQKWTSEPFGQADAPTSKFVMIVLPDGYHGLYVCVDHRLIDSTGVIVMINDIMELYCHYQFDTPMPEPLPSFIDAVKKDLEKAANPRRAAKDEQFWTEQALRMGEPIYTDPTGPWKLEQSRKAHGDPNLRAADRMMTDLRVGQATFHLEPEPTGRLIDYCMINEVSMTNLLLMGLRTYLSKRNGNQPDVSIKNYVSRRSTSLARLSGGSRVHCFPCRTIIPPETEFLEGVRMIQQLQNSVYRHADFDSTAAVRKYAEAYHIPPKTTYESTSLTYQPLPIRLRNPNLHGIPYKSNWLTNGTAIQKLYLTVMHDANKGLEFYFKYQQAELSEHDVEELYYYVMRIVFLGVDNPEITVGEILKMA